MICVTGPGGTVGSELITQLESAKAPFRAAHFSNAKADAARARGIDTVIIDYSRPETLRAALQGCDKLFGASGIRVGMSTCLIRVQVQASEMEVDSLAEPLPAPKPCGLFLDPLDA